MKSLQLYINRFFPYLLVLLLVFSFATRIWRLSVPKGYMFDEVYHALTAKLIARGDERAYEWWHGDTIEPATAIDWLHPPLAKLFQAVGIRVYGETEFGWRISSVIFGVLVTYLTVLLALELFDSKSLALLSGLLFSLDGLGIAMSRIAMNDIHVTFFILLSAFFFIRMNRAEIDSQVWKKYALLTGVGFGLSLASKWSGFFVLPILVSLQTYLFIKSGKFQLKHLALLIFTWIVIPAAIYLLAFGQMWLQGKDWAHFKELNNQVWYYQTHLEATHPAQSVPLQWMLNTKPVWMSVDYSKPDKAVNVYAHGNTILFWTGILTFMGLIGRSVINKNLLAIKEKAGTMQLSLTLKHFRYEIVFLLIWYFAVWLPWSLSPRIMFFYHYTPAVPFLSILVAYAINWLWKRDNAAKYIASIIVVLIILNFIIFYPNWTGLPVSKEFQETWYYLIPSWQQT